MDDDKKCNCCGYSMTKMGCRVTNLPMYWCPTCGGISACEGEFATPALALSEAAEEWFATLKEIIATPLPRVRHPQTRKDK